MKFERPRFKANSVLYLFDVELTDDMCVRVRWPDGHEENCTITRSTVFLPGSKDAHIEAYWITIQHHGQNVEVRIRRSRPNIKMARPAHEN